MSFSLHIIKWYKRHKRDLPWRNTKDPYLIWLSEIILQQTRVNQGLPYYCKFIENFPKINDLSAASEEKVLQLWQGLGYYSRGRNLHHAAQTIVEKYKSVFPNTYTEIKKLKGVGDYTAAAIASFAFDEKKAVVDGNVIRVLTRYFGIEKDVSSSKTIQEIKILAENLLPQQECATYNQAIMEFGALQCVPKSPKCDVCPINESCEAYKKGIITKLPYKSKKTKVKHRFFNFFAITQGNNILLKQRTDKDIWQNLFDFPLIESSHLIEIDENVIDHLLKNLSLSEMPEKIEISETFTHILSHQKIKAQFTQIELNQETKNTPNGCIWVSLNNLDEYGKSILIQNYLNKYIL